MAETDTVDAQGGAILVGIVFAGFFLVYGALVSQTLFGVDTMALTTWTFAATFGAIAIVHVVAGRSDLALAYAGGAVGWALTLIGETVAQVGLGLLVFALGGIYIVRTTLTERHPERSE